MTTDHASADLPVADLPQGKLAYRAAGPESSSSPPVVFVHGVLVDGQLWGPVAERLAAEGVRSYAPTLPFGSHQQPDERRTPTSRRRESPRSCSTSSRRSTSPT